MQGIVVVASLAVPFLFDKIRVYTIHIFGHLFFLDGKNLQEMPLVHWKGQIWVKIGWVEDTHIWILEVIMEYESDFS